MDEETPSSRNSAEEFERTEVFEFDIDDDVETSETQVGVGQSKIRLTMTIAFWLWIRSHTKGILQTKALPTVYGNYRVYQRYRSFIDAYYSATTRS